MKEDFNDFIGKFRKGLYELFNTENDIDDLSMERGLPDEVWEKIMSHRPLSVAIPEEFGGRGLKVSECLGILSTASYESLSLSLTFGINIALFLEPMAKYGHSEVKAPLFRRFLEEGAMGGLMITEPDYGSDALNMQTHYTETPGGYKIRGRKHWQGLTGMADYWIVAARKKGSDGRLSRDVEFFMTDNAREDQKIHVDRYFNNLGLYMIPYGLNSIDLEVPRNQKLQQTSTGIKMMLDILHRSRLQFPGMGMGFIKRMLDEAIDHCNKRIVAGKKLIELDAVRFQVSRIQAAFSLCSGMCARSSGMSGIDQDVSAQGLEANSMKALVTDLMQESAQLCVQLSGSSGYKLDHIAGRGIVDSRPFQIFEGSNEMLYTQIAEGLTKAMKKLKNTNLASYLSEMDLTDGILPLFKKELDFTLPDNLLQRQLIVLGKIVARLVCLQYVQQLADKGFRKDLFDNCYQHVLMDVNGLLARFTNYNSAEPVLEYRENSDWSRFI